MTSTELATIDDAPQELAPLTETKAKALVKKLHAARDQITTDLDKFWSLVEEAALGQAHVALGYPSWTAFVKDNAQVTPSNKLERQEWVKILSGKGMSQREIAGTLNVSQKTVDRDLEGQEFDSDTVTGADGREFQRNKPPKDDDNIIDAEVVDPPESDESPRKATNVIDEFRDEIDGQFLVSVQALKDFQDDELFDAARKRLNQRFAGKLRNAAADLDDLLNALAAE